MEAMDFIKDLNEFRNAKEAEELAIKLSGDLGLDKSIIDTPAKANYFLKLLKDMYEEIDQINMFADEELQRVTRQINEYREQQIKSLNGQVTYFETMLRDYTIREIQNSKKKSVKLPYGTLQLKKTPAKYVYDDQLATEFLIANMPEYIKKKETISIDKAELKKVSTINENGEMVVNGQVIPGTSVIEQEDSFSVK